MPSKDNGSGSYDSYGQPIPTLGYEEAGYAGTSYQGFSNSAGANVGRKKSMVRPERERVEPGHRLYHYREHATADEVRVQPSSEFCCKFVFTDALWLTLQRLATSPLLPARAELLAFAAASQSSAVTPTSSRSLVSICSSAAALSDAKRLVRPRDRQMAADRPRKSLAAAARTLPLVLWTAG